MKEALESLQIKQLLQSLYLQARNRRKVKRMKLRNKYTVMLSSSHLSRLVRTLIIKTNHKTLFQLSNRNGLQ